MTEILIPKIGMTMVEATISSWLVADGAMVDAGTPILTIETEKSETDVEAAASGVVRQSAAAGQTLPAGAVIGWIDDGRGAPVVTTPVAAPVADGRRFSSPNARRVARERGIDLAAVSGTGPNGRITSEDVEAVAPAVVATPAAPTAAVAAPTAARVRVTPAAKFTAVRLGVDVETVAPADGTTVTRRDVEAAVASGATAAPGRPALDPPSAPAGRRRMSVMRRTIATRMVASLAEAAQLTLTTEVRMDEAVALRARLKAEWDGDAPSINDLVLRSVALALVDHPGMNARIDGDELVEEDAVHLGMAVALDAGLVVPVLRHAADLPLAALGAEARRLAGAARSGALGPDDLTGGTFSVSNLGPEGVDAFTPILNPPNVGILGVGRLRTGTEWSDGVPAPVSLLTLSLTWDHRALDGVPAARFAATVKRRLEAPLSLLR